jgi:integrase
LPTVTLTDITIGNLKPADGKRITYLDRSLKGFGVMVMPAGHASYVLTYGPDRRRVKLGDVGVVKLADARLSARERLSRYQLGQEKETDAPQFEAARDEFLKAAEEKGNKQRTIRDHRRLLTRHFARWNRPALDELMPQELQKRLDRIRAPSERRHAYDAIKVFMRSAERRHYIDRALTDRMGAPAKGRARKRVLTDEELRAVWKASAGDDHFSRIVRLCILTGRRRSEIAQLEASMIERDLIRLPPQLTKNPHEHLFPIGPMMREIVAALPSEGYLFPPRKTWRGSGSVYNAWGKDKPRLDQRSGVTGWVLHDLRRTFSSNWAMLETPIEVTEKYINHISGRQAGVQGIYNRFSYLEPMKRALEKYERWLHLLTASQG